jgi:Protein of unknown function (DUF2892)
MVNEISSLVLKESAGRVALTNLESFPRLAGFSLGKAANMEKNLGKGDRAARGLAVVGLLTCSIFSPLPLLVRVPAFGVLAVYLLYTVLSGTCLGYALLGKSTCPAQARR